MSSPAPILVGTIARPLAGKKALVTGASRGIGAAIAKAFAAAGADVVVAYSASPEKAAEVVAAIEATGQRGFAIRADQANQSEVKALVEEAVKKLGGLDILVNNAGVNVAGWSPAVELTAEQEAAYDRQFAINVTSVATAVRAAAKHLPSGGRIITIGSGLGKCVPFPGVTDYAASKAALTSYTKGWARDFGSRGVTVNLVQPGITQTDMTSAAFEPAAKASPAGRVGLPEEIAAAVLFIATPAASFVTGSILDVDGGITA